MAGPETGKETNDNEEVRQKLLAWKQSNQEVKTRVKRPSKLNELEYVWAS